MALSQFRSTCVFHSTCFHRSWIDRTNFVILKYMLLLFYLFVAQTGIFWRWRMNKLLVCVLREEKFNCLSHLKSDFFLMFLLQFTCKRIMLSLTWWRHQMKIFSAWLAFCGEIAGHWWIPLTKASDAEFWWFFLCAWTNGWINNRDAGDLSRHHAHYDVTVVFFLL